MRGGVSSANGAAVCHASQMGWKEFVGTVFEDSLVFIASIVSSVAWPVMIFVVVLLLLNPIKQLIGRMKGGKLFGAEFEFEMRQIEQSTEAVVYEKLTGHADVEVRQSEPSMSPAEPTDEPPTPPSEELPPEADDSPTEPVVDLHLSNEGARLWVGVNEVWRHAKHRLTLEEEDRVVSDPSGAILGAWQRVLTALSLLHVTVSGSDVPTRNVNPILERLKAKHLVSDSYIESVRGLYKVRNDVAHSDTIPSPGVARTYVQAAATIEAVTWETVKQVTKLAQHPDEGGS